MLTEKQKRFCAEYLIDLNATQAAIRAGYSPKTAVFIGSENLRKPNIRARVDEELAKIESAKVADAAEVMQYLTAVMRDQVDEDVVVVEGCGDGYSDAKVVRKKLGGREKIKAAELLAKRYGLLTEKVNVTGAIPVIIAGDDMLDE